MAPQTMQVAANFTYDVASALSLGQRDAQEDAVLADFPLGHDVGFCVLADGMGGHASGDVASKIVVTEVFSELKLQSGDAEGLERNIAGILTEAAQAANSCVRMHSNANPASFGMGATLVAPVLVRNRLYWISVGDSPLYLFRDGHLRQLNEDHSLGSQIDMLVRRGLMPEDTGAGHPDRHCLTSVLIGSAIPRIDCPSRPVTLQHGDIIVVASDGLQFLDNSEIEGLIQDMADRPSAEITACLIRALDALADPEQDNVSVCVIKIVGEAARPAPAVPRAPAPEVVPDTPRPIAATEAFPGPSETSPGRITLMARRTREGLSMFCHVRRKAAKSA